MFTKTIEQIFTKTNLLNAYNQINKNSKGIDEVSFKEFEQKLHKNIQKLKQAVLDGLYAPEPIKQIEIQKNNSIEKRPIAISAIKDKIIQRTIYNSINNYFDKLFSDKSYAYRPNKSTLKAINRVSEFLNKKNFFVVKTDIDNFFETINHDKLLNILNSYIIDKRLIKLISLFLQTYSVKNFDFNPHNIGVHQGDILSPLLSNIYLNEMDMYLEKKGIYFVRYGDDFVLFFDKFKKAKKELKKLQNFLKNLNLKLEESKTKITHIKDGFTFLGVNFIGRNKIVENERFQKTISHIINLSKNKKGFKTFIKELNSYFHALKNYYLKLIIKNSTQYKLLQDSIIQTISHKIYLNKSSKTITTKKEFKILLSQIELNIIFKDDIDKLIKHIISIGYEKYLANKSYKEPKTKIEKKKNKYAKKFANDSTLHITRDGFALGISKNKFVLKQYGKVYKTFPIDKINRIIFEGKGFNISSNLLQRCAKENIPIDFIDNNALPYASLITYKATISQTIHKQAMILNTPLQLTLAKEFIKSKAKNQLNYLKYLNKYHKLLSLNIKQIEQKITKIKNANSINELMGFEGSISTIYWDGIRLILDVPFEKRITFGAKDIVNSSLNYAYAILYGKIQHSLVFAGLSLNISFLHSLDDTKPTLAFDMIEEFRTFIVDRTIIAILNKDEPIKLDSKGLLTKDSRKLIAKNIKEKLGSYTMYKKQSWKIENIIQTQCYKLADFINGKSKKYKGFIGKY